MKSTRSKTAWAIGLSAAIVLMVATAGVATARQKKHSTAAPIPTGANAQFTLDFMTFYGWFDNSPPGLAIAHPDVHSGAGGTGTFEDPISFAVAPQVQDRVPPGTIMYIPSLQKYFVMEDDCTASGPGGAPVQGDGCDGELLSGVNEFDLWIGGDPHKNAPDEPGAGSGNTNKKMTNCEDTLTANKVVVIMNATAGQPVNTTPLLNNGKCIQ
jgi:hypothetical protein